MFCWLAMVTTLDATLVNVALPVIGRHLGADAAALSWVVNAYTLSLAGLLVLGGAIADRIGRKIALYLGLLLFITGSVAAAAAESVALLIGGRWVMGAGAALMMPTGLSTISAVFVSHRRALAAGVLGAAGLIGAPLGPLLGGALLGHFGWPSVFAVNIFLAAPLLLSAWKLVPETRARRQDARPFDWGGAILATTGTSAVVWSIVEAPQRAWLDPQVAVVTVVAFALLTAFVVRQRRTPQPMLPLRSLSRVTTAGAAVLFWCYFALLGSLFAVAQYLQLVLGYSPLDAGLRVLPVVATTAISFISAGELAKRLGLRTVVSLGLLLLILGLVVMSEATASAGFGVVLTALLLVGLGMGVILPLVPTTMINAQPPGQAGVASAIADTSRYLGGALGTAVVAGITTAHFRAAMTGPAGTPVPSDLAEAIVIAGNLDSDHRQALKQAASTAFTNAMATAHLITAALVAAAVLFVLFLPAKKRKATTLA
ncbi:MFS transporter [Streptomyces sp. NPDC050211]|uniref:MFS transporter n=1 Tax=Streptomyces sp. NPDC050211 TaxID=3154932 RepID=UPI0034142306